MKTVDPTQDAHRAFPPDDDEHEAFGPEPKPRRPRPVARFITTLLLAVASLGLTAGPAMAATTGGDIDLLSGSAGYVVIWQHNGFSRYLYPGQSSYDYYGYYNDVQKFRPASGTACRSQYSGTSYPYRGGVTYTMSHDNINFVFWCKRV